MMNDINTQNDDEISTGITRPERNSLAARVSGSVSSKATSECRSNSAVRHVTAH